MFLPTAFRIASAAFFLCAFLGYWKRPDLSSVVGVSLIGVATAVALYRPSRRPARWQSLFVLLVVPIGVFWESGHESVAKDLVGDAIFGHGIGIGLLVGLALGVMTFILVCRPQPRSITGTSVA